MVGELCAGFGEVVEQAGEEDDVLVVEDGVHALAEVVVDAVYQDVEYGSGIWPVGFVG